MNEKHTAHPQAEGGAPMSHVDEVKRYDCTQSTSGYELGPAYMESDPSRPQGANEVAPHTGHTGGSMSLEKELQSLLNSHSVDAAAGTPDFVLAGYLLDCLAAYRKAKVWIDLWLSPEGVPDAYRANGPSLAGFRESRELTPAPEAASAPECTGPFTDARSCPVHRKDIYPDAAPPSDAVTHNIVMACCESYNNHDLWISQGPRIESVLRTFAEALRDEARRELVLRNYVQHGTVAAIAPDLFDKVLAQAISNLLPEVPRG